jgi:hypothetical protein
VIVQAPLQSGQRVDRDGTVAGTTPRRPVHRRPREGSRAFSRLVEAQPCTRQNDPKFSELAGLGIDLYRPAMLLDDDVVANGKA